ncbi:hypothetical protein PIB30_059238 [Stylosanthes scabra]|uniref:Uncharacterized protein n=1 Tax=Stylosanthes scabra TaxID=79078 RepID=A0ABU6TKS1_9FABA|nr:hypothetical protein [Stylosanthes scabra]
MARSCLETLKLASRPSGHDLEWCCLGQTRLAKEVEVTFDWSAKRNFTSLLCMVTFGPLSLLNVSLNLASENNPVYSSDFVFDLEFSTSSDLGTSIMGNVPRLTLKHLAGFPEEDPIKNLKDFEVICATTRRIGGNEDAVKAFALPFFLEGKAKDCEGLTPTDKGMIDASSGGAFMNKMLEEVWELIETVADSNQHFKTRATNKGVYEVAPSESTILAKSLVNIASMLKEIKEGQ